LRHSITLLGRLLSALPLVAMFALPAISRAAGDADYPNRPLRLIVPYPPGAGTDGTARIVAEALGRQLGQPIVVENKPGASGVIGSDYVAKAPPDGYTLLWTSTDSMTAVPALRSKMPYKVPDDFSYIAKVADTGMSLVVSTRVPATSIPEFIAYAKAHPGKLSYGTSGIGGSPHLATLLFEKYAGIEMTHVPYKGVAPALTDLLGGQIDFALLTPITIVPFMGSDKMRVIGITAPTRHPMLPDAPTVREAGIPQATATVWYGLFGPARMSPRVLERLRKEVAIVAAMPSVKEKMAAAGLQMSVEFGDDFQRSATVEFNQWQAIVKAEGLVVEE
jgi:tripartite-type tricarboxylate transporter receptor subunit TctC